MSQVSNKSTTKKRRIIRKPSKKERKNTNATQVDECERQIVWIDEELME